MSNNPSKIVKTPTTATTAATIPEYDYFFLYDKAFMGFEPPMQIAIFCVGPCVFYLFCVFVIFPLVAPKSKTAVILCSKFRYWHNIFMFLFSLVCFIVSFYEMYIANEFGFITLNLKDMMPMLCNEASDNLKIWYNVFLVSKIYEWVDTAFLVWLKNDNARAILAEANPKPAKKVTEDAARKTVDTRKTGAVAADSGDKKKKGNSELNFLHLYHHATTFWLYLMMYNLPGMMKMGLILNSYVHSFMYLHYSKPLPMPFLITISQILQLAFGTWVWYLGFQHCSEHKGFIENHWYDYLSPWLAAPVYLLFFIKFFIQRFILKPLGFYGKKKKSE